MSAPMFQEVVNTDPPFRDVTVVDAPRDMWLEWRRGGVGGSDIAALAGLSRWSSPLRLFYEKQGLLDDETSEETSRMRLGRRAEQLAKDEFGFHTSLFLVGEQTWCEHLEFRHHRCTADGFAASSRHQPYEPVDINDVIGPVEVKVTSEFAPRWSQHGVPLDYQCQAQWQMHVTGYDRLAVLVFYGLADSEVIWVDRSQSEIDDLVFLAERFWQQLTSGDPPEPDGHDATTSAILAVFPEHEAGVEVHLDDLTYAYERWQEARAKRKEHADAEQEWMNHIRLAMGAGEIGMIRNEPVLTYRSQNRKGYSVGPRTIRVMRAVSKKEET